MSARDIPQQRHELVYTPAWDGLRLKEILLREMPKLGSRDAFLVITNGLIEDESGKQLPDADTMVTKGRIYVDLRHGVRGKGEASHPHLHERMKVYHDDEHIVVVSKKAGTVVQPTDELGADEKGRSAPLIELLQIYWKTKKQKYVNPIVVQRLDMQTSGLLVLAKTVAAARSLQAQLKPPRSLGREYLAVVAGKFLTPKGMWKTYIGKGYKNRRSSVGPGTGQEAITHYSVEEVFEHVSLLRLKLETGRTHQIRVHCAESGHPIWGDRLYWDLAEMQFKNAKPGTKIYHDSPLGELTKVIESGKVELGTKVTKHGRVALHSTKLSFKHPDNGIRMAFEEPLPRELKGLLK